MAGSWDSKTSIKQTSYNVGATIVGALATAGLLESKEEALATLESVAATVFADLATVVPENNGSPEPRVASSYRGRQSGAAPNQATPSDPGEVTFNFGRNNGQTIAQVAENDMSYLTWLTERDTNPARNYIRQHAQAYLDSQRAGV